MPTAQLELLDYGTIEAFKLDEKGVVIPGAISWHKDTNRQVILHDFATDMFALKKSDK